MPKYIMQEAMNAVSIPTYNPTTLLKYFCAPVIHVIRGESFTSYKIWQNIQQQGKSALQHLERNGKACTRRKKTGKRDKFTLCPRSQINQKDPFRPHSHICKNCYRLPPIKEIPQLRQDHCRRQPHKLPMINHNKNSWSHNIRYIMEQNHKHHQRQTHVRWHKIVYLCNPVYKYEYMIIPLSALPEHIIQ